jgi:hypothetical protein
MKMNIRTIALATLAITASLSLTLHAATRPVCNRVNVPFAFNYGSAHFAPGIYNISMLRTDLMELRGGNGHVALAIVQTEYDSQPRTAGKLVFKKYGDRYFLSEVWEVNTTTHLKLFETKQEKHAAKELISQSTNSSRVELALVTAPFTTAGD